MRSAGERVHLPIKHSFDEILLELTRIGLSTPPPSPRKVLVWGEKAGEISSYVAGWMAGEGIDVIVLDGANRFDPYIASSFARKTLLPPERILKRIRIARAFTCYQMATLMGERVGSFLKEEEEKPWVIILGPITTFLDGDVLEREVRPLFDRSLRRVEEMTMEGVPLFLFQPSVSNSPFPPFTKNRMKGLMESRKAYLTRRLFQFSNEIWRISLEDEGPRVILEKGLTFAGSLSHSVIGHSMT